MNISWKKVVLLQIDVFYNILIVIVYLLNAC